MKIRWFIVDDEPPAVDELLYILIHFEVMATAGSASEGMDAIKKYHGPSRDKNPYRKKSL
jgi:DNA-binding LytR/AlgR family response regulator